jgi:hypothetical protein
VLSSILLCTVLTPAHFSNHLILYYHIYCNYSYFTAKKTIFPSFSSSKMLEMGFPSLITQSPLSSFLLVAIVSNFPLLEWWRFTSSSCSRASYCECCLASRGDEFEINWFAAWKNYGALLSWCKTFQAKVLDEGSYRGSYFPNGVKLLLW